VVSFCAISGYKKFMVPTAESFRRTGDRGLFGRRAGASLTFFSLIATATLTTSTLAFASGFSLEDDSALIVGSDSVIYSLNLSTGVATAGATLSGDSPTASFTALEADPTSDAAYLGTLGDASLSSIDTSDGTTTFIEDDYGFMSGAGVDGIVRLDDGVTYLSHIQPMGAGYAISQVDLSTGVLSGTQLTSLSSTNTRVTALAHVDDTVYAFVPGSTDTLYTLDPSTGVLTQDRAASGVVTSGDIVAADSTADGVLYLLAYDAGTKVSTLYSLDPASGGTTTSIAPITGLAAGKTAENLAIATLLDSERPADSEPSPSNDSDSDRDDEEVVEASPAPPPPVYKPPTKTLPKAEAEPEQSPTVSEPGPEIVDEPDTEPTPDVRTPVVAEEANGLDGTTLALVALSALALVLLTVVLIAMRARSARR
jgi:hypothetical protein